VIGALITIGALYAWGFEPSVEPEVLEEIMHEEAAPALTGAPGAAGELGTGSNGDSGDGGEA